MADQILSEGNPRDFVLACQAMQDTTWCTDPANPTMAQTGPIQKDERIWLQQELFGNGPIWQPARLADGSVRFINPHHFNVVTN